MNIILGKVPQLLFAIEETKLSDKKAPEKWSKKEILGHLIDSATNNHQRFVRAQFEINPQISYDQENWNKYNFYQDLDGQQIIIFWTIYNKQLLEIIKRIPDNSLPKQVRVGENNLTLEFLIIDYVEHLEHHLKQIVDY